MAQGDEPRRISLPDHLVKAAERMPAADPLADEGLVPPAVRSSPRPAPSLGAQPGEPMYPCPCPCGCGNDTTMPERLAEKRPVSARRLRCYDCSRSADPKHAGHAPEATDPPTPAAAYLTIRSLREQRDPLEKKLDEDAAKEMDAIHRAEEWEKWIATVPEKFRGADKWDDQVDPANKAAIQERLRLLKDGQPTGALLTGPISGGKSWLAYMFVNMAVKYGLVKRGEVRHGTELELLGKAALADWNERAELLKALLNPRLRMLLIDDVGRDMHTRPEQRRALYDEIANWAWARGRVLIITTNLKTGSTGQDPGEDYLAGWVGPAAYSRISTSVGDAPIVVADRQMRAKLHRAEIQERKSHTVTGKS